MRIFNWWAYILRLQGATKLTPVYAVDYESQYISNWNDYTNSKKNVYLCLQWMTKMHS